MSYGRAFLILVVASLLAAPALAEQTMTGGKIAKFANSQGLRATAVIKVKKDPALSDLPSPACPQRLALRITTGGGYDSNIELPCDDGAAGNWKSRGRGYSYTDRSAATGVRKLGYARGSLTVKMRGRAYWPLLGPLSAETPRVELRFVVGDQRFCGRFEAGLARNESKSVEFRGPSSTCDAICGDGALDALEACDDGNLADGDGCTAACETERAWVCVGDPSQCAPSRCGDGVIDAAAGETCDDANAEPDDGCSASCSVEHYSVCDGEPSVCVVTPPAGLAARVGSFGSPSRIALGPDRVLYLADSGRGQVAMLDTDGNRIGTLEGAAQPLGVAAFRAQAEPSQPDPPVLVYVGDESDGSVKVFADGVLAGQLGAGAGEFGKPNAIWVTSDGSVHVVDSPNHTIKVYNGAGAYVRQYGDFWYPSDIVIDEAAGEVFVSDFMLQSVAVVDLQGNVLRYLDPPLNNDGDPIFTRPIGLGADSAGRLYVVDNALSVVATLDRNGNLLESFGYEGGAYWNGDLLLPVDAVSDGRRLYVSSNENGKLHVFYVDRDAGVVSLARAGMLPLSMNARAAVPRAHMGCGTCHDLHLPSYPGMTGLLCESCHVAGGTAPAKKTHSSRSTDNGYGDWDVDCWGCHDPHEQKQDEIYGTSYGKLLRVDLDADIKIIDPLDPGPYWEPLSIDRTVTATIRFTSDTEFVNSANPPENDICQACHVSTAYYAPATAPDVHADYGTDSQPDGVCTKCHSHGSGFAGDSCIGCHASAQPSGAGGDYRRKVVEAGGDFERTSHHVSDGSHGDIVSDEDCGVCHQHLDHQTNADPTVKLYDADTLAVYTYDGAGSSVEGFCLSCHDADSSQAFDSDGQAVNGQQPFSDGSTPVDISSAWAATSHNQAPGSALGDDACLACHGGADATRTGATAVTADQNAHGSANASLLSSLVNGVSVSNVEEQLCYACHDGSEASTDLETEFAKGVNTAANTYHHPIVDAEQSGGRSVECASCHDPHGATTAAPWLGADGVDLDGNAVAAIEEYEVCLACHGDDYNAGRDINGDGYDDTSNKRLDFAADASAYHPVQQAGRNTSGALAQQLIGGLTIASTIMCSDCHNNQATADAAGVAANSASAPQGPHGSTIYPILRATSDLRAIQPPEQATPSQFALCLLCHSQSALIDTPRYLEGARTNFYGGGGDEHNLHWYHVTDLGNATCRTCHYNTHGNQALGNTIFRIIDGDTVDYSSPPAGYKTRLVNFSPEVQANNFAKPLFSINIATRERGCDLICHGEPHRISSGNFRYTPFARHGQPGQDDDPLTY